MRSVKNFPRSFLKTNAGFSLIELLVVISFIGILASIAVPRFMEIRSLSGLNVLTGSDWNLTGGLLTSNGTGERRIGFGDTSWTDYTYEATAVLLNGTGYSLYYRTNMVAGTNNPGLSGYSLQYDPGPGNRIVVRIVTNGSESSPIWSVPMPASIVSTLNQSHTMAITVSGNQHTVTIDGAVVGSFTDSKYTSGAVGLRTWGTSQVSFDSVSVTREP